MSGVPAMKPVHALRGMIVDDDALYARTLQRALRRRGLEALIAPDGPGALAHVRAQALDFALVDLRLEAESGLALIAPLRAAQPAMRIVLITGYASIATAVEAIKRGADDYLLKPTTLAAILRTLQQDAPPAGMRRTTATATAAPEPQPTMTPLARLEWEHIHQALSATQGNVSAAARLLGMHRRSLQRKLAKRPGPERMPSEES